MAIDLGIDSGAGKIEIQLVLEGVREAVQQLRKVEESIYDFAKVLGLTQKDLETLGIGFKKFRKETSDFVRLLKAEFRWIAGFQIIRTLEDMFRDTIGAILDYDKALSMVKAQALATQTDMLLLKQAIIDTTRSTTFSIGEIGQLATVLARAGLSGSQVAMVLKPIAQMAMVTGENLDTVGKLIISILGTYNLYASDANKVTQMLAVALNKSKLDLSDVADAWKYVAGSLATTKDSLKDVLAIMMVLRDKGNYTASTLGTAIRQIYRALVHMSPAFKQYLIKNLHFTKKDFEDLNLQTHSLVEVIGKLKEKGVTAFDVLRLMGTRVAGALALLIQRYDTLKAQAEDLAETISGDDLYQMIRNYTQSIDAQFKLFRNEIRSTFAELRDFAKPLFLDLIGGLSNSFKIFSGFLRSTFGQAGLMTAGMLLLARNIRTITSNLEVALPILVAFRNGVQELGIAIRTLSFASLATKAGTVIAVLSTFLGTIIALKTHVLQASQAIEIFTASIGLLLIKTRPVIGILLTLGSAFSFVESIIKRQKQMIPAWIQDNLKTLIKFGEILQLPAQSLAQSVPLYKSSFEKIGNLIRQYGGEKVYQEYKDAVTKLLSLPSTENAKALQKVLLNNLDNVFSAVKKNIDEEINTLINDFSSKYEQFYGKYKVKQLAAFAEIEAKSADLSKSVRENLEKTFSHLSPTSQHFVRQVKLLYQLKEEINHLEKAYKNLGGTILKEKGKIQEENKSFESVAASIKNLSDKIETLNQQWKYLTEYPISNINDIKALLRTYKQLESTVQKLNQSKGKGLDSSIQEAIALAQLNKKYKELVNVTDSFLKNNSLSIKQLIQLKLAFEKAGISASVVSKSMEKSFINYINQEITNGKQLLKVIKDISTYKGFLKDVLNISPAKAYEVVLQKTLQLWNAGLLKASTLKKILYSLPQELRNKLKESLILSPASNLNVAIDNLKKLEKLGYSSAQALHYLSINLDKSIESAKNFDTFDKILTVLNDKLEVLKKHGINVEQKFKSAGQKISEEFSQGNLNLQEFTQLLEKLPIESKISLYKTSQYIEFLQSQGKNLGIILDELNEKWKTQGDITAKLNYDRIVNSLNAIKEKFIQLVIEGKMSYVTFNSLFSLLGTYGQQSIDELNQKLGKFGITIQYLKAGLADWMKQVGTTSKMVVSAISQIVNVTASTISNLIMDLMTKKFKKFKDFIANFTQSIMQIIVNTLVKIAIYKALAKAGISAAMAAKGAIFPGEFIPVQQFAYGGVVNRPTIGIIGEGKNPEAVVPLPDGKAIPVKFVGDKNQQSSPAQSSPTHVNIVNVLDPKLIAQYLSTPEGQKTVLNVIGLQADKVRKILLTAT